MERIIEMAAKKGLLVKKGTKTLNNGEKRKTYIFSSHDDDVVMAMFEKDLVDAVSENRLELLFDECIVPVLEAEELKKGEDAPQYIIDLLRTGTIFPEAINAEANEELLKEVPHRRIMDLALVYRVLVSTEGDAVRSILYTNQNMKLAGITEEELFRRAVDYARKNIWSEDVYTILGKSNCEIDEETIRAHRGDMVMFRYKIGMFGAGILALWAMEDGITIDLQSDKPLFVLPSSIHELLVVRTMDASKDDVMYLASMVKDVNSTQVDADVRLSNSVYMYDPETKKIKLAKCGEPLFCCDEYESYLRKKLA